MRVIGSMIGAGALALAGCSGGDAGSQPSAEATSEAVVAPSSEAPSDVTATTATVATSAAAAASTSAVPALAAKPAATPTPRPTTTPEARAASAAPAGAPASFAQCAVCHAVQPGRNGVGPSLAGVYGTKAGDVAGYSFSPALKASGLTWNDATLDKWLAGPAAMVPGTRMAVPGVKDAAQRKALIAYIKALR